MMGGRTGVEHCSSNLEYKIMKYFKNYTTLSLSLLCTVTIESDILMKMLKKTSTLFDT